MIRGIWAPSLVEILPPSVLKDSKLRVAAEALDFELQKLSLAAREALLLPRLDELPHEILDQLAYQYHVDFFEPTEMDLETKRKLIRNSIYEHRIKGTKFAVENLLNKITAGAEVQEWFEYGGRPYYFRVNLKGLKDYGDNGETFMRMIEATKNARSWLDDIIFDLSKEHPDEILYVGQLTLEQGKIFHDQPNRFTCRQPLQIVQSTLVAGNQHTDIAGKKIAVNAKQGLRAGFAQLIHGKIRYDVELSEPDDYTIEDFERYIRQMWEKFKQNPVVEHYKHNQHGEDPFVPDTDEEEDFPPIDKDFLRLWWKFWVPNKHGELNMRLRTTTILDPREDITAGEIKSLGLVGAAGEIFVWRNKDRTPTSGLYHAALVHQRKMKII